MALKPEPSLPNKKPRRYNSYLRYGGLAFQLLATIGVSGWLGYLIDQWLNLRYPVFMIVFILAGFAGSLYKVYRSFNRQSGG
ncbi:MAG: AtpZ/AtpI family protein [Cyclobacteriaceae bacterium]